MFVTIVFLNHGTDYLIRGPFRTIEAADANVKKLRKIYPAACRIESALLFEAPK